jgi:C-methyltransferase C-terminal domain/Putative zinc binding domain/Methyltransferase domain
MTGQLDLLASRPITACQICGGGHLQTVLFLGYVPPVNTMSTVGDTPETELRFPLQLLCCRDCLLVQIGYEVDSRILFPHTYPYLSGTTRILRDNFQGLALECEELFAIGGNDLVVDVGANDGTLLKPFLALGCRVVGIEPSQAADVASSDGLSMVKDYFSASVARQIVEKHGLARLVSAANVFAHIGGVHDLVENIKTLMEKKAVFVSESHYLIDLIATKQYDTVYHEHLRYYSLHSLRTLFTMHGLEIFRVKRIPTHGGSIRVFAAASGSFPVDPSVSAGLADERNALVDGPSSLQDFRRGVMQSKLDLMALLADLKRRGARIFGVGAPSRASTLITYVGLDESMLDCIVEVRGSHKLNKYMPGTRIPVLDEEKLYQEQPDYALLLSWHIADELRANLQRRGYCGRFIVPLPTPIIVD